MKRDYKLFVKDILDAINNIEDFIMLGQGVKKTT